jgi:hypothetical protein
VPQSRPGRRHRRRGVRACADVTDRINPGTVKGYLLAVARNLFSTDAQARTCAAARGTMTSMRSIRGRIPRLSRPLVWISKQRGCLAACASVRPANQSSRGERNGVENQNSMVGSPAVHTTTPSRCERLAGRYPSTLPGGNRAATRDLRSVDCRRNGTNLGRNRAPRIRIFGVPTFRLRASAQASARPNGKTQCHLRVFPN